MNTLLSPTHRTLHPLEMLRQFDRVVQGGAFGGPDASAVGTGSFPVDVREEGDTLVVEAELPGFGKDQIDVNVENGLLTIEADRTERKRVASGGGDADDAPATRTHLHERSAHVSRRFTLPKAYDAASVEASLEHGVLTLRLPKREDVKPRKIEVK